jgi:SAM-dependent methyltransferase
MNVSDTLRRIERSLRHRGARGTLAKSFEFAAHRLQPRLPSARGTARCPSDADEVAEMLGLQRDPQYRDARHRRREEIIERLAGCAPANAFPGEMVGYLTESALRFDRTLEWVQDSVQGAGTERSLLETGSNPYFLTILLKETFPLLRHAGINYFGDDALAGRMHRQEVIDPRHRLEESVYFYADIERHPLEPLGVFDICLFCEVIEHLVFDPAWALFNLLTRVKVGGRLILTTPNPARLENICRLVLHSGSTGDPISGYGIHGRHNREYTAEELHDLVTGAGCTVIRSQTIDVGTSDWSRAAEDAAYGQYHMIEAKVDRAPTLYRPNWLYRSFNASRLASHISLLST